MCVCVYIYICLNVYIYVYICVCFVSALICPASGVNWAAGATDMADVATISASGAEGGSGEPFAAGSAGWSGAASRLGDPKTRCTTGQLDLDSVDRGIYIYTTGRALLLGHNW